MKSCVPASNLDRSPKNCVDLISIDERLTIESRIGVFIYSFPFSCDLSEVCVQIWNFSTEGNKIDDFFYHYLVSYKTITNVLRYLQNKRAKRPQVVSIFSGFSINIICNNNVRYYQIYKSNENQNATCSNVFSWFPPKYCIIAMSTSETSYTFHSTCVCSQRVIIKLVKATACEWFKMSYYSLLRTSQIFTSAF